MATGAFVSFVADDRRCNARYLPVLVMPDAERLRGRMRTDLREPASGDDN